MRKLFSSLMLLTLTASVPPVLPDHYPPPQIESLSVPLDSREPDRVRIGALRFLGAWEWRSKEPAFGGFSSLRGVGDELWAVGDSGTLLSLTLGPGGAIGHATLSNVAIGPGAYFEKKDRDSESLAVDEASGQYWIGFEATHMIRRYDIATGRLTGQVASPLMQYWPSNGGAEAMERLADGRFIVFSEAGGDWNDRSEAILFSGDPVDPAVTATRFVYRPPAGYRVTDAAQLPDGRLLLLHRRFTIEDGVSAVISVADPADIKADNMLEARVIARFAPPLAVDNMEGLAVTRDRDETIVWLISDDNFSRLQRTLLMKFALQADETLSPVVAH